MTVRLHSISCTETEEYEVILDVDGAQQSMRCRVVEHAGIRVVEPDPDFMTRLPFSPRVLAAALLAFDDARKQRDPNRDRVT
jgi:hypothetical protein